MDPPSPVLTRNGRLKMKEEKFYQAIDALSLYGLQKYLTTDELMNLSSSTSKLRKRFRKYFLETIDPDNRWEAGPANPSNKWIRDEETIEAYLKECQGVSPEFCKYLVRPCVKITENTSPESIRRFLELLGENLSWIHLYMRNLPHDIEYGSYGSAVCEAPITLDFRDETVKPECQKPCILQFIQQYNPNLRVLRLDIDFKASDIITNQYPTLMSVREFSVNFENRKGAPVSDMCDWSRATINPLLRAFPNLETLDLTDQDEFTMSWTPAIYLMNYILENKYELCPKLKTIKGLIYPENEKSLSLLQENAYLFPRLLMNSFWNSDLMNEYGKLIKTVAENGRCESIELVMDTCYDCQNFKILPDMNVATVHTLSLDYDVEWEADINFLLAFNNLVNFQLRSDGRLPSLPTQLPFIYTLKTLLIQGTPGLSPFLAELKVLETLNLDTGSSRNKSDYEITNDTITLWNTLENLTLDSKFVRNGNNGFLKNFKNLKTLGLCGTFEENYQFPLDCQFKDTLEEFNVVLQSKENNETNFSQFVDQFIKLSELILTLGELDNSRQLQFSVPTPIKHVTLFKFPAGVDLRFLWKLNLVETIILDETNLKNSKDFNLPGPASKANYAKSIRTFFDPLLNLRAVHIDTYSMPGRRDYCSDKSFLEALQDYFMSRGIRYKWRRPEEGVIF